MDNITIEVADPDEGLFGCGELWITFTGPDPLPDWPSLRRLVMQRFNRDDIPTMPLRYYPSWGGPEEPYTELWVVRKL